MQLLCTFQKECRDYINYRDSAASQNEIDENLRMTAAYNECAKLVRDIATYTALHYGERQEKI